MVTWCLQDDIGKVKPEKASTSGVAGCPACGTQFKGTRRKHHCKACGQVGGPAVFSVDRS